MPIKRFQNSKKIRVLEITVCHQVSKKFFRWIVANPVTKGNGVSYTPLSKLKGTITPNGLHFERHHYGVKDINPKNYQLKIETPQKKEFLH